MEDAGLRDVTRYSFARELVDGGAGSKTQLPGISQVIAEGNVDLFNEGQPRKVALPPRSVE